jgi:hypothetical protein
MEYIESVQKQFQYYKLLGDKTIAQLSDVELFWQYNQESNSVAIIIKHLWGNMLSRWTDFLTTDGEKVWRKRDEEFELKTENRESILEKWEAGWQCLFIALDSVNAENFDTLIYIRNQGHSITEAINRQLTHYAYHVGQMVFVGKMIKGNQWNSLSISKGSSQSYNHEKFSQAKHKEHFTGEYLVKKEQP